MQARWIRLGALGQREFDAAWASLAAVQARTAAPILLWAEEAARYPFALIAPLKFAPGRKDRWLSWGLASAVATYRQFGVPAYLDGVAGDRLASDVRGALRRALRQRRLRLDGVVVLLVVAEPHRVRRRLHAGQQRRHQLLLGVDQLLAVVERELVLVRHRQ